MEFERKELEEIKLCLEDRATKVNEELKNLKLANWENIGGMQNMYANKKAFEEHRDFAIGTHIEELEQIDNLLERIYEEM